MSNPTMKPSQRVAIEDDLASATEALTNPQMASYIQDKGALQRQANAMKKTLDEQAPKPYEAEEVDRMAARERQLREEFMVGMPSKEEMRKKREDSVYKHMTWEKANKAKILEWREIKKRLEYDSDDPGLTSYERYRPERPFAYDTNAQIKGHHAMSEQAKENWPEEMANPTATTAVSHLTPDPKPEGPTPLGVKAIERVSAKTKVGPNR